MCIRDRYGTLDPKWPDLEIAASKLCSGDLQLPLRIVVWDWNKSGSHDLIGRIKTTAGDLLGTHNLPIINSRKKRKKKRYKNSGTLNIAVKQFSRDEKIKNKFYGYNSHSFLEYIAGGCEISLSICIDWTGSNGDPSKKDSLHYIHGGGKNQYTQAINAVVKILGDYDSDKLYPVFGFGGRNKKTRRVSHCFPLNGNEDDPEVAGIDGVIAAYMQAFEFWDLYGPTNFAEMIRLAAQSAKEEFSPTKQNYFVLLILTDGCISDMKKTIKEIVEASGQPLSIVIVGVGNDDFEKMDVLDADDTPLVHNGKEMERDIVQFVPFNQFRKNPDLLAQEVLTEIPGQLTSFMSIAGVAPRPPQSSPARFWQQGSQPPPQQINNLFQPAMIPQQGTRFPMQQGGGFIPQPLSGGFPQSGGIMQQGGMPQLNVYLANGFSSGGFPQQVSGGFQQMQPQKGFQQTQQMQPQQLSGQSSGRFQTQPQQSSGGFQQAQPQQQGSGGFQQGQPQQQGSGGFQQGQPQQGSGGFQQGQPQQSSGGFQQAQPQQQGSGGFQQGQPQQQGSGGFQQGGFPQGQPQGFVSLPQTQGKALDPKLHALLESLNYLSYADTFVKEDLTYEALQHFEKADLKELGLPLGPRLAIYKVLHG
eukprot:TRINITY_DN2872_c0_g1_i1.p1 TRINITY_DN2872_c0_g1~~TRINITY_DN2872_c0_g1_i1.p1  ORF type:complete len:641 (-),score=135.88 TRINITY_DN2872_c0_g1_i1:680-2602(-)